MPLTVHPLQWVEPLSLYTMHITTVYMKLTQLILTHLTSPEPSTPSDRACISSQGLTLRACVLGLVVSISSYKLESSQVSLCLNIQGEGGDCRIIIHNVASCSNYFSHLYRTTSHSGFSLVYTNIHMLCCHGNIYLIYNIYTSSKFNIVYH